MPVVPPLPVGSRLFHIGPHKTGSTALQSAFHAARYEMDEEKVRYGSYGRHDGRAIRFITDRLVPGMDPEGASWRWDRVKRRTSPADGWRSVMSSEFFSDASDQALDRIAAELNEGDVWIAVTLRPLAKILPSQYQQSVQRGGVQRYQVWLESVLAESTSRNADNHFWVRHGHDELVRRWAQRFGAEKVIVVVLDSADHGFLPRTFEQLLDLTPGVLESKQALENRSMTAAELAVLRRYNQQYRKHGHGPTFFLNAMSKAAAVLRERKVEQDELRLVTPDRFLAQANEIGTTIARNIAASGVRVVGDLDTLGNAVLSGAERVPDEPTQIGADIAAQFAWAFSEAAAELAAEEAHTTR